ncbi:MAG: methyltransferase domain-containing protein [Deltaproteobacteria bacterium]|nr:methyltransferase domain-containing protein [Deltaproteobacteria bacterium]
MAATESTPPAGQRPDDESTPEYREWLAAAYDTDVHEQWFKPFSDLVEKRLEPPARGMVLEVACATGRGTERLLASLGGKTRLVAQEGRGFLLDLARARLADHVGSRLFFNSDPLPRLRYDEKVFSAVVSNYGWWDREDRDELLQEMIRVLDDEGLLVLTAPLAGTFGELVDLAREVAVKLDLLPKLEERIEALERMFLTPEDWQELAARVGFDRVRVDCTEIEQRFASSRELFAATLTQAVWSGLWRRAFGDEHERVLWHVRQMIDAYWADTPFPVTIAAGCLTARRPHGFAVHRPAAAPKVDVAIPVVLDGESQADREPDRPATSPPGRDDGYIASGDAIAAELLGLGPTDDDLADDAEEALEEVEADATATETGEPEPLDEEALDAEPLAESPSAILSALEEPEPYVPDEGDLHAPDGEAAGPQAPAPYDPGILEVGGWPGRPSAAPVAPVPLGRPQAAPVAPVPLGRPRIHPLQPVELDAPTVEPEEVLADDWDDEPESR